MISVLSNLTIKKLKNIMGLEQNLFLRTMVDYKTLNSMLENYQKLVYEISIDEKESKMK